jgi:type IV pilus assembly protein PilF
MNTLRLAALLVTFVVLQACAGGGGSSARPSPDDAAVANMNLGAGYLRQGRYELAIERLLRALEQNPRLADAHSTIAIAYDQLGRAMEAEEHYERATQLGPDNSAAANSYAVFLCRQNRWTDAKPYFRRAADNRAYTTPEVALTNAGLCARNNGDIEGAEDFFREALSRSPAFPDALTNMMDISYKGGNYMQARAFVQRYLDARPPTAQVLLLCFDIERELKNAAGADKCASQLRIGFQGSPELARLEEQQDANGR